MKVSATVNVFMSDRPYSQERFLAAAKAGNGAGVIDAATLYSKDTFGDDVKVGTATVTITIMDDDAIRLGLIETLKIKKAIVLADAQREAIQIEGQIQNLLAIAYEETV
ncbi:MAG: hypothetical protein WBF88_17670 [Pusillimonas sp.]